MTIMMIGSVLTMAMAQAYGGSLSTGAVSLTLSLVAWLMIRSSKPGSRFRECFVSMDRRGKRIHPLFWPRLELAISLVSATSILMVRRHDLLSVFGGTVLLAASICKYFELEIEDVPRWISSEAVTASIVIYAIGGVILIGVTVFRLVHLIGTHDMTVMTSVVSVAKLAGELDAAPGEDVKAILDIDLGNDGLESGTFFGHTNSDKDWMAGCASYEGDGLEMRTMGSQQAVVGLENSMEGVVGLESSIELGTGETMVAGVSVEIHADVAEASADGSGFDEFICQSLPEAWMVEAMKDVWHSMSHLNCIGGMDFKCREQPGMKGTMKQAMKFVKDLEAMWRARKGSLLDELRSILWQPASSQSQVAVRMTEQLATALGTLCTRRFGGYLDSKAKKSPLSVFCLHIYTMQDVDIDRLLLFKDVPSYPRGKESPAERDEHYREYRAGLKQKRNPQMFQEANWATRTLWNSSVEGVEHKEASAGCEKYIKWLSVISALRLKLDEPAVGYRGLCGLPDDMMEEFRKKQPHEMIFWAALSSVTLDEKIAVSYANQHLPLSNNVIFEIREIRDGLEMMNLSIYPKEREFLLPMCSILTVESVIQGAPLRVICTFGSTLLTEKFQREVLKDLQECSQARSVDVIHHDRTALNVRLPQ